MFAELQSLTKQRRDEERERTDPNGEVCSILEQFRHFQKLPTFLSIKTCEKSQAKEMAALVPKVKAELKAGERTWIIILRPFNGAPAGAVCQVAPSEFEWLQSSRVARLATPEEIAERKAMDVPYEPLKSWARGRHIRNACQALRPVRNK